MKNKDTIAFTRNSLTNFAQDIFSPLKNGECVCCMFVVGGGKRTTFKFLLSEKNILRKIFNNTFDKTLFIFINPDEILNLSTEAYLQLIFDNLISKMKENKIEIVADKLIKNPLILVKKNLEKLTTEGWHTIFILNNFEFTLSLPPSIYLNLESIMAVDKSKIVYLFLLTTDIFEEDILKNFHNLKYALSRNIKYFSLLNNENINYFIDCICKKIDLEINSNIKNLLIEMCGGHPQMLKYSLYYLKEKILSEIDDEKKVRSSLFNTYQLKIIGADMWNNISEKERNVIINVAVTGNLQLPFQEEIKQLLNLGLIKKINTKKYQLFGTLFEQFIKNKLPKYKLRYDIITQKLFYGNQNCEDRFTFQEFKLLVYFVTHENELTSRDQVAQVIWGKFYHDKYSDWSIDKTISIIRKKLDILGFPSEHLVTLKKRGFSFSNP